MDARVRYQAETLNSPSVPLNDVSLELELNQSVMTVEPMQIGVGGGEVTGRPFSNLQGGVVSTGLLARGVASVLGAIVAPPLVELGLGEDAGPGCREALQEFENPGQG